MRILFCLVLALLLVLSFRSMQEITQNAYTKERPAGTVFSVPSEEDDPVVLAVGAPERNIIRFLAGISLLVFVIMNSKRPTWA